MRKLKVLIVALMALALAGCSGSPAKQDEQNGASKQAEPAKAAMAKDGQYTAEVTGHNAKFKVVVDVKDGKVAAVAAPENLETIGVGKVAIDRLSKQIVDNQSVNIDGVTGATFTSMAVKEGVEDCLKQAGADVAAFKSKHVELPDYKDSYDADVCIVGGGGSGLAAAMAAHEAGAKKIVIVEKIGYLGGSTNVSEGALNAVDPKRQGAEGIEDSVEKFYTQTFEGGHKVGNPELVHYLTDHATDTVSWLESLGVEFKDKIGAATGSLWQRSHYTKTPSGNSYIRVFEKKLAEWKDGITVLTDCPAKSLIVDKDGGIAGVNAEHKGKPVVVNAKSVILATGGFGANVELRQKVNTGVWKEVKLDKSIGCTNIEPCAQGDGIKMAEAVGADVVGMSDIQLHPCGTPGSGLMTDIRTSGRNRIFVNEQGARFVNEGAARDALCKAIFAQPDSTYYVVVNKIRYPEPNFVDRNGAKVSDMIALGRVVEGKDLDELAKKTGMDPAKLKESVEQYNAAVKGAEDPFGFKADNKDDKEMTEGPWYACKKVPTVHHTMGGIKINTSCQVLNKEGAVKRGLYACGEVTGGIHGSNRLGGNAIADAMTFGRQAGTMAAKNAAQ